MPLTSIPEDNILVLNTSSTVADANFLTVCGVLFLENHQMLRLFACGGWSDFEFLSRLITHFNRPPVESFTCRDGTIRQTTSVLQYHTTRSSHMYVRACVERNMRSQKFPCTVVK